MLVHVIMHLGLCASVAKLPPEAPIAIAVRATDKREQVVLDRTFRMERGDDQQRVVEFDVNWGIYQLTASIPKYNCNAAGYFSFLPELDRSITAQLADGPPPPSQPMLLDGAAPESFLYLKPTFVLLDKAAAVCDKPVPDPLPSHIGSRTIPTRTTPRSSSTRRCRQASKRCWRCVCRRRRTSITTCGCRCRCKCIGEDGRPAFSSV